jgi:uncharacterized protein YndB with AHSA1/START domain
MIDIVAELNRVHREVVGTEPVSVLVRRELDADVADVWDACTDPARIGRWFLPVTGDFTLGGRYQFEGNAGGEIVSCEPPRLLRVTWVFGDAQPSTVEVRLAPAAEGRTLFELEHSGIVDPAQWDTYGPGAVGVGWDGVVLGLAGHLTGAVKPEGWEQSPEARQFVTTSSDAWAAAHEKAGATSDEAARAARNTAAFYTGMPSS